MPATQIVIIPVNIKPDHRVTFTPRRLTLAPTSVYQGEGHERSKGQLWHGLYQRPDAAARSLVLPFVSNTRGKVNLDKGALTGLTGDGEPAAMLLDNCASQSETNP